MLMAALGGCRWPLEVVPENMQKLGHLFPSAWAMDILHRLISFGDGIGSVAGSLMGKVTGSKELTDRKSGCKRQATFSRRL